jgi:hypothetical protein
MRGAVRNGFRALVILSSIFVGGTTAPASGAPMNDRPSDSSLPPGAIPAGEGVYMVPITEDAGGCMQYRMYAPGRAVVQAIFYADGKGGFTRNRAEADCPPAKPPGPNR